MKSLVGLNDQQKKAVQMIDRHLLVVAGAGSGKTRVLTHKIAYLIEECQVLPSEILAMTFTNKAGAEMKQRIKSLVPFCEQPYWVGTFHSTCLRLLREFCDQASLSAQFTVYDESDQLSAIKQAIVDLKLDPKSVPPKEILFQISRMKNETDDLLNYLTSCKEVSERSFAIIKRYEEILCKNQALDFGDLLTRFVKLLKQNPSVAETLKTRWKRILIDEYQDTNTIQKQLVQLLTGTSGMVCAVGDEDQSIYTWRGARIDHMLDFCDDFRGAQIIKLEQNYRSSKQILAAANYVIQNNVGRREKKLWTENSQGSIPTFYQADDDRQEASFVMRRVVDLLKNKTFSHEQIAIMYRTHAQSRLLEEECRLHNVSYRVFGGARFFDRMEIKDTLSYMKLAVNPLDDVSFRRIINVPARGIGKKTIDHLEMISQHHKTSLFHSIPLISDQSKKFLILHDFYQWFFSVQQKIQQDSPVNFFDRIMEGSGYLKALQKEATFEAKSREENLLELKRSISEFSERINGTLVEYLHYISLFTDADKGNHNSISLMTVHNSKGLEFDAVFLVGMEEGIFPHQRALDEQNQEELEEERRLCYVAMTRARHQLILTSAIRRKLHNSILYNQISRFIEEIPSKHLLHLENEPADFYKKSRTLPKYLSHRHDEYCQESFSEDMVTRDINIKEDGYETLTPGTRILHPNFGVGIVRKCEGEPSNVKLVVQFQTGAPKKLLLNLCSIEVISS